MIIRLITKKGKIFASVFAISMIQMLQLSVSAVLSGIQDKYPEISVSMIQMLVTAPMIGAIIFSLLSGWLTSLLGKKKLLLAACLIAALSGLFPLMIDSFNALLICRLIFGISMGLCMALNAAVVADFFSGEERTVAMGIQSACIGISSLIVTFISGSLGRNNVRNSYWVNLVAVIAFVIILICLPAQNPLKAKKTYNWTKAINKTVIGLSVFGFFQVVFLTTFITNISMHIANQMGGGAKESSIVMGMFSISQIITGLFLGRLSATFKHHILPFAIWCFACGAAILILPVSNMALIMFSGLLCGFTQGVYMPQASTDVTNSVDPSSTTTAAAILTCGICLGQTSSPVVTNVLSMSCYGEITTNHVYFIAMISMAIIGALLAAFETSIHKTKGLTKSS